jgi:hypothetical protein
MTSLLPHISHLNITDLTACGGLKDYKTGAQVVLFYHQDSKECVKLAPEYDKLTFSGKVLALNAGAGVNSLLIQKAAKYDYNLQGYPTIVCFVKGESCSVYTGERTATAMKKYLEGIATSKVCSIQTHSC